MKRWLLGCFFLVLSSMTCLDGQAAAITDLKSVAVGSDRYVSLKDVAAFYGLSLSVPPGRFVYLRSKWNILEFETQSRQCSINGVNVWLNAPVVSARGRWSITETDVRKVVDPILRPHAYLGARRYRTVVIDPGHGGLDRGAKGRAGVEEKRAVLDIAKSVRAILVNEGLRVYMTRDTDRFIELADRSYKATQWGADIFVSIHLNAATTSKPRGVETYVASLSGYPSTSSPAGSRTKAESFSANRFDHSSDLLGYYVQKALVQSTGADDRGLRRARFMVVKNSPCPAVLVEGGFLSNKYEEQKISTSAYRQSIARGIAKGVLDYVNTVKKAQVAGP